VQSIFFIIKDYAVFLQTSTNYVQSIMCGANLADTNYYSTVFRLARCATSCL